MTRNQASCSLVKSVPESASTGEHKELRALALGDLQYLVHSRSMAVVVQLRQEQQEVQAQPSLIGRARRRLAALHSKHMCALRHEHL